MKCAILKNFINHKQADEMARYLDRLYTLNQLVFNAENGSHQGYKVFQKELNDWVPRLEKVFQKQLFSTYSFARIYKPKAILTPHIDRYACEYSITLCLDNEIQPWPIFLNVDGVSHRVILEPGDALAYMGIEQPHWREQLETGNVYQAFFHYVDQNGPYASLKDDPKKK